MVQREELVLWGHINDGGSLCTKSIERELGKALKSTGLQTLDMGVVSVRVPSTPYGQRYVAVISSQIVLTLIFREIRWTWRGPHRAAVCWRTSGR